uniref:Uncharacterized protein n=1 Tax=Leptobrachium leishanense TaxID=445787 RepID=A0A8C5MQQ5_9ANUR
MGAKLTKKKKGYCLGAGKDGESTETTEVEQKETQNQDGQKDAAESNGEKPSTDQTETNGTNEGPVAEAEKQPSEEVPTGESTKDDSKVDQTPDTTCSEKKAETVEKISTCVQEQCSDLKEGQESCGSKGSSAEDHDVKAPKEVVQTVVVLEKNPVQETLVPEVLVKPAEEPKQTEQQEKPSALEQKEPEIKQTHEVQNAPSEPAPDHSKQEPVQESVVEVAKSEQSNVPTEGKAEEPPKTEVIKIEPVNVQEPKGADVVVTAVEPAPTTVPQEVEPLAKELPATSINGTEPPSHSETVSDQKPSEHESQGVDLQHAEEENVKVEVQPPTEVIEEQTLEAQNSISQNGPTEQCEPENIQGAPSDSAEQGTQDLKVEDHNEEQNIPTVEEGKRISVTEVPPSPQNRKNYSNPEIVISLPMSEGPKTIFDLYEEESQNTDLQNEEESQIATMQNVEVINEKVSSEPQQTNDKHLIGNGLPVKEEMQVKETLENESDNAIGDVNGQSHEIMCRE